MTAAIVILLIFLALLVLYTVYQVGKLVEGLERAQLRVAHAHWLLYRNWADAREWLGECERDIARTLNRRRIDIVDDVLPAKIKDLEERIRQHRDSFPKQTYT